MLHVLPFWNEGRLRVRKCANISSNPVVVKAATISYFLRDPYGCAKSVLKYPTTSSSDPRGLSLIAATTLSIVKMLLGAR